jgi:hypothetical protein
MDMERMMAVVDVGDLRKLNPRIRYTIKVFLLQRLSRQL